MVKHPPGSHSVDPRGSAQTSTGVTADAARRVAAGSPLSSVRMSRFLLPAAGDPRPATGALALGVAVLGLAAAGCNNSGGHPAATATAGTPRTSAPCKLDRAERHAVARALADIRHLRRIQAPMHAFPQHGAPTQNVVTGKFMLDVGSAKLPLNVRSHLIHLAKAAVSLCGDCSVGLEGDEPFLGTHQVEKRCG